MSRGPLPDPDRRRRNAPTIPTTDLPLEGRKGAAPTIPSWVTLGKSGRAWWRWAWTTPQACAWGTAVGLEPVIARRASLEDDLAALEAVRGVDFDELEDDEDYRHLAGAIRRVAALATGRLALLKEMRELDDRLGLTPKGMAGLRWKVTTAPATPAAGGQATSAAPSPYAGLRVVAGE